MTFLIQTQKSFTKWPFTYHYHPIRIKLQATVNPAMTIATMLISLIRMLRLGTGGVFERVADRIAYDCRLMGFAALAAVVSFFDMFLGVVPGASRIGHEDRQYEPCSGRRSAVRPLLSLRISDR